MHTNRISPARKFLVWLGSLACLTFLVGCENVTLTDLTPPSMAANPSQIYTFSLRINTRSNMISGLTPKIVVNGQSYPLAPSPLGQGIYDFEYQLPAGYDQIAYYYLVNYNVEGNNVSTPQETYTA